jgi:hypothetical protein
MSGNRNKNRNMEQRSNRKMKRNCNKEELKILGKNIDMTMRYHISAPSSTSKWCLYYYKSDSQDSHRVKTSRQKTQSKSKFNDAVDYLLEGHE